jgi:hypothetical protein
MVVSDTLSLLRFGSARDKFFSGEIYLQSFPSDQRMIAKPTNH